MNATDGGLPHRLPRLDIELAAGCDHGCGHCYNVWNATEGDPQAGYKPGRPLSTNALLTVMTKAVKQAGVRHITFTGGEPLLHRDALDVIEQGCRLVDTVTLITNGSHVPPDTAQRLGTMGVTQVQLTLLSADRDEHDRLKGAVCFDDTVRAAVDLLDAGVFVQICFVAMRANAHAFEDVVRLCHALGVKGLSYNRMSPTGGAVHQIAKLMPTADQIEHHLHLCETLARGFGIRVGTAMPIPPCLIRLEKFPWVNFGFCSTGTESPNIVLDPAGNVRSCNLASGLLGNWADQDWAEIRTTTYQTTFKREVPEVCRGCAYERSCQGGCKESGFAVFGDRQHPEPLLFLEDHPEARDVLPVAQEEA